MWVLIIPMRLTLQGLNWQWIMGNHFGKWKNSGHLQTWFDRQLETFTTKDLNAYEVHILEFSVQYFQKIFSLWRKDGVKVIFKGTFSPSGMQVQGIYNFKILLLYKLPHTRFEPHHHSSKSWLQNSKFWYFWRSIIFCFLYMIKILVLFQKDKL